MRLKLILVIAGIACIFFGVQEIRLRSAADEIPQEITCADLEANGPGDNAHVVLSDFILCDFAYVYEEKNSKWSKVWIPAVPLGGEYHQQLLSMLDDQGNLTGELPMPNNVSVIVKSSDVQSESDVELLSSRDTVQGVIVNVISSLGSDEKKILKDSYPSVNFDQCWILEVGRKPASMGKLAGFCLGGLALLAVGGVMFLQGSGKQA